MRKMRLWIYAISMLYLIGGIAWADSPKDNGYPKSGVHISKIYPKDRTYPQPDNLSIPNHITGTIGKGDTFQNLANSDISPVGIIDRAKHSFADPRQPRANDSAKSPILHHRLTLQGGDDFAGAVAITSLPYTDTGTTEGYTHDYDLSCAGSTSPDVVYSYSPTSDDTVIVSLLRSGFDTILGIFEDSLSNEIACNDQFGMTSYSYVGPVNLLSGHTYYIVVGGYGQNSGDYILEMFNPPAPPANDNCVDVIPQTLIAGTPLVITGNLSGYGATDDCPGLSYYTGIQQVWVAFTTTELMDVRLDLCGSNPAWQLYYRVISSQCCASYIYPDEESSTLCSDGNIAFIFKFLPPGTYYYPIVFMPNLSEGQYTVNLNGTSVSPCSVECPSGAITEIEPNDGCWVYPTSDLDTIQAGDVICGSSWVSGDDPREVDNDCYALTLSENRIVNITIVADFRCNLYVFIPLSEYPCDYGRQPAYSISNGPCDTLRFSQALVGGNPGAYAILIQPAATTQFTNGTYVLSLTTEQAPQGPPNDRCEDITPENLSAGQTIQRTGDNTNAYTNCPSNPWGSPEVWEAFTLVESTSVIIDFCGTFPEWTDVDLNGPFYLTTSCPCSGGWDWIMASTWDSVACADGNWTSGWYGLPPGTYYLPINSSPEFQHPYTINLRGLEFTTPHADTLPCDRALFTSGSIYQEIAPGWYAIQSLSCQCDPSGLMNDAFIDDFVLPGEGAVSVDTAVFYCNFSYDENAGPYAWDGVEIAIYNNNNGEPGGHPLFPNSGGCTQVDEIPGGVIASQTVDANRIIIDPPAIGEAIWRIKVPIIPLSLQADSTYWINIQPIQDYSHYSLVYVASTNIVTGNLAKLYWNGEWVANDYLADLGFCLLGPSAPSCSYLPGDINGDDTRVGGDVTYGVRYFKGTGPAPLDSCLMDSTGEYLYVSGDVNGNCEFRGSDITRLVAYFKGGAQLSYCHFFPPPVLRENKAISPKLSGEN